MPEGHIKKERKRKVRNKDSHCSYGLASFPRRNAKINFGEGKKSITDTPMKAKK